MRLAIKTGSRWLFTVLMLAFLTSSLQARITRIVVIKSEPYLEGKKIGDRGSFIKISGQAFGEIDPVLPLNSIIQDIGLAPKNEKGYVEYVSDFVIVRPADMTKSNGLLFLSLPNRGNVFPADEALLARGYTYFWCAWQGDVLSGNNRLLMKVPYAGNNGASLTGIRREEYHVSALVNTLILSSGVFTGQTHRSYPAVTLENTEYTLTKRVHETDERIPVPNGDWAFSDCSRVKFPGVGSYNRISLKEGFEPNFIYELVYMARDPLVLGLGFAAIRDFSSFLKNSQKDDSGFPNPLADTLTGNLPVKAAIMQGVSQCGNFARTFLHLGFNKDETGKQVFEGVNVHIGSRRISLNVRFGRPGGGGMQHEDHLFPGNEPPYTWDSQFDPISGITGGLLVKSGEQGTTPKIIQTLSSTEYWQSRASLGITDSYGTKDLVLPQSVRLYLFSGTQHTPSSVADPLISFQSNNNNYFPYLRALVVALEKWVLEGKEPPASCYPTIAAGTLVSPEKKISGWPDIPGVNYTGKPNELPLLDYGASYDFKNTTGILTQEPPMERSEQKYKTLIPKVDKDGNEIGGIRSIDIWVPLGTYTGWSLRKEGFGKDDQASLTGMFIPFKKTKEDRIAAKDPRLSVAERYKTHEKYIEAVKKAAGELVAAGFLLQEDAAAEIDKAEKSSVLR